MKTAYAYHTHKSTRELKLYKEPAPIVVNALPFNHLQQDRMREKKLNPSEDSCFLNGVIAQVSLNSTQRLTSAAYGIKLVAVVERGGCLKLRCI